MLVRKQRNWNFCAPLVGMQNGTDTGGKSKKFLKKLKLELPCDPAIPLLGIH